MITNFTYYSSSSDISHSLCCFGDELYMQISGSKLLCACVTSEHFCFRVRKCTSIMCFVTEASNDHSGIKRNKTSVVYGW